jgi:hypothetical protein
MTKEHRRGPSQAKASYIQVETIPQSLALKLDLGRDKRVRRNGPKAELQQ